MKPTVLIVDDVRSNRDSLRNALGDEFHVVGEAEDGLSAVEKAIALRPRLILMDVVMPSLSGIEATRRILGQLAPPPLVVMVSGLRDEAIVLQAFEAGAVDYLFKPVEESRLVEILRSLLKTAA